ncbi:hypothetical protein EPN54_01670 [bacterium]|nr:MAG: hypothetical protein EPN54_01670 [bacterium]
MGVLPEVLGKSQIDRHGLIQRLKRKGAARVFFIESGEVPLDWKAVMLCLDCKVNNSRRMKRWSCPPYAFTPDKVKEMLEKHPEAVLVNLEVDFFPIVNRSWDSFDPFLQIAQKFFCHFYWGKLHRIMLELKEYLKSKGIPGHVWGSSPCHACFKCSYPRKCRKPGAMLISPEASGIDLYRLAATVGIPIEIPPKKKIQLISLAIFG